MSGTLLALACADEVLWHCMLCVRAWPGNKHSTGHGFGQADLVALCGSCGI